MPNTPCRFWFALGLTLLAIGRPSAVAAADEPVQEAELAGYLLVPHGKVSEKYNAGFSLYVAAWPLLKHYPGQDFQSGLFGTWMSAQFDGPAPKDYYSDVEGGLGWWHDTRFATETPKFIMGGVALNFSAWANGPGAGKGRDWKKPAGQYAVAQLSPWCSGPIGINLRLTSLAPVRSVARWSPAFSYAGCEDEGDAIPPRSCAARPPTPRVRPRPRPTP